MALDLNDLRNKATLLRRWIGIVIGRNSVSIKQDIGKCYKKGEVAGYYNDLTGKVSNNSLLDEEGIPINELGSGQKVYFPINIFQYSLGLWDLYLTSGDSKYKNHFLKLCEWTIIHQRKDGSWDCFSPIGYKTQSVSAMGQGEAISVLIRAYTLTNEQKWLSSAKKAAKFMLIGVENGGVVRCGGGGSRYLEEYPGNNAYMLTVLNGWVFATFGLYDYLLVEKDDTEVRDLFDDTVRTMASELYRYDNGYWSLYDLSGRIASPHYHQLHIALLKVMYELTEISAFSKCAERWAIYCSNVLNKTRAVAKKIIQKTYEKQESIVVR